MWLNNRSPDKANTQTRWQRGEGETEGGKEDIREELLEHCTSMVNKDRKAIQVRINKVINFPTNQHRSQECNYQGCRFNNNATLM